MINIYDKTETVFNHSGLATLEPIECVFAPMINDVWKLEMTLPYDSDEKYKAIENERFIRVTDIEAISEQASTQLFRIYDFKKQSNGVYVLAYPVGLDARFETLTDYLDLRDKTASQAIALINNMSAKYTVTTDLTATDSAVYENKNMIEILNGEDGFVHKWGGEICYDNYNIKVNNKLGSQSGSFEVRYGKNLLGMDYELDSSNVITRIYPKSQNGDILNYYEDYAYGEERYVDSSRLDPNFIHNYFVEAPYVLTSLNDDGSLTYIESISLYNDIKQYVASELAFKTDDILNISHGYGIPDNLDLNFIKWFYSLTMEEDLMEGYAERVARLATVNLKSPEFKEFAKKAIMDGFKSYFDSVDSEYDWGSFTAGGTQYADGYYPGDKEDWRWHSAWAKGNSAWQWCESNGAYHESSSTKDTDKWDWYKKKGRSYKRYGNKKKENSVAGNYLQNGLYKINDVWYYFNANGKSTKAKKLFTSLHLDALYDGMATDTFQSDTLASKCENAEAHAFYTLYMQMTDYCVGLLADNDQPKVSMEIDIVDLSKTTEYEGYEQLLKVHLGDKVHCVNIKYGYDSVERVIGVEYDVLRGFNRKVMIGLTDSSTINMLNVTTTNETKLVAGEGVEIHNNVISVKPQPSGVKDVIVNGESVVIGDVASFDLDEPIIEGAGLEYFVETENTISGDEYITEHTVTWDDTFDANAVKVNYDLGSNSYSVGLSATPINKVMCVTAENVLINTVASTGMAATPGFMLLSKNQEDVALDWHYIDRNGGVDGTGTCAYSTASLNTHTLLCYELYYQSGTCTVNNETWYGIIVYLLHGGMVTSVKTGFAPTINKYVGGMGNIEVFQNYSAIMSEFIEDLRTETTTSKTIYNGIARKNKLAFFAGGDDEDGTNAPIKIYADGTYEGITKAQEITKEDYDGLTEAQKTNGTLYIVESDADIVHYQYRILKDGQIVARKNNLTGEVTWWFNGFSNGGADWPIPDDMVTWLPQSGHIYSLSYDSTFVTPNANIGLYNGSVREWSVDTTIQVGHPTWGVVTNSGGTGQTNPYSNPPNVETAIYYMGKKITSYYVTDTASSGGGGGGSTGATLLTKAQYDALTPAQQEDGSIYFVYATADPNYEYRVCKDGQIIVQRNKTTGDVTWWFIGYSNGGNDWAFPQDMQNYDWMPTSNLIYGVSYDSDKVTQNANIGVYNGYAREWDISTATLSGVTTWGVVTNSGGNGQNNPWSDPPDANTENAIYYMGVKFSAYDIGGAS